MAEVTGIEWCDHTFNAWVGCQKVSAACDFCYAEAWAARWGNVVWGPGEKRRRTGSANWMQPIKWNRQAIQDGVRRKVFCCSLADVFDNAIDPDWRADLWKLIRLTPGLDWLLLTKRPQNIAKMLPHGWLDEWTGWPNVWLGTTVESQEEVGRRIRYLDSVAACRRFLSCEPLLEEVDLGLQLGGGIHWVICGGESGPNARPMEDNWARSLRDQCEAVKVPFFMKQMGGSIKAKFRPIPDDLAIKEWPL